MELKTLIKQMNNSDITLDKDEISILDCLDDGKYNILRRYLSDSDIKTTNDLKRLSATDYSKLKVNIPDLDGVGEEKTSIFIRKLDMIRNGKNVSKKNREGRI